MTQGWQFRRASRIQARGWDLRGTRGVAIAALGLLLLVTSEGAGAEKYDRDLGYHREVRWVSASAESEGQGLFLFRSAQAGLAQRVFVETPAGRHIILDETLHAQSGVERVRLIDDETGWWAEVTKRYGFESASLDEFFDRPEHYPSGRPDRTVTYTVRTSNGFEFESEVPARQPEEELAALAEEIEGADAAGRLAEKVPEDLLAGMGFLRQAVLQESVLNMGRSVIDVLSAATRPQPLPAGIWEEREGPARQGLTLADPDMVRFISRFATPLESLWGESLDDREP